jgi:acyl-homoserine-lactone acylase
MWTDYLTFDELPKSIDPPSGFHQNENEAPWLFTLPPLDPAKYASYIAPAPSVPPTMRPLRALHMITEDPKISYEMLVAKKHSTRMELADKILPDLLKAANAAGGTDASRLLEKWDRTTDADSRGGVLFQLFVETYMPSNINGKLRVKWDPAKPLDSAYGLADPSAALKALETAAAECLKRYGALDVKWGDVYRYRSGPADVAANGGAGNSGVFRTITFSRREGNKFYAGSGETIVCAIEFASTQRANCTLGYGNASQPGSPHVVDQLPLMQAKQLHPVWRAKKDVEANLEKRESF